MNLVNKILIAPPSLSDPRFRRAVIYICSHNENGSLGLVVNSPNNNITIGDTLAGLELPEIDIDALKFSADNDTDFGAILHEMPAHLFKIPVLNGGPVELNRGFILHGKDYEGDEHTLNISDSISMTSTASILADISIGKGPKEICFAIGYVGWAPEQLDHEINSNNWLIIDANDDIIFSHDHQQKYDKTMKILGITPDMYASISNAVGSA